VPSRPLPEKFLVAFSFAGEQRDLVRKLVEGVEKELGSPHVFFDEWFEAYLAGDDADLKLMRIYGEISVLVVVCISERYGGKPWTKAEHRAIRARFMQAQTDAANLSILPIRVGEGDVPGVLFNTIVPDIRDKTIEQSVELVTERLRLVQEAGDQPVAVGSPNPRPRWPDEPLTMIWPMANHTDVRAAFQRLLTREAPWRLLTVRGPSASGKSSITKQMLRNALRVPNLACGRFDFKGTTTLENELQFFVQDLGVPPPPAGVRLNAGLGQILDSLKQAARPALLIFDTYEAAGEGEDWVEKQLLPGLIRCEWLRVVVSGQSVPKNSGAIWEMDSSPVIDLKLPSVPDWWEFGKQYHPDLQLTEVEVLYKHAEQKPTLLAQLLGPRV
jgi:hypothetical protein